MSREISLNYILSKVLKFWYFRQISKYFESNISNKIKIQLQNDKRNVGFGITFW